MSTLTMTGPEPVTFNGAEVMYDDSVVTFEMLTAPVGLLENTLTIDDQADGRSTASFRVYQGNQPRAYALGQIKQIANDGTLLFGGIIDQLTERQDTNDDLWMDVNMVDYVALLDRHLVAAAYQNQPADDILRDVLTNPAVSTAYLEQFGLTEVTAGPTIQSITFNYVKVSEAISELAQYAGFQWNVTPDKTVVFKSRDATMAPFSITETSRNYRALQVARDKTEYRNRQYLRAGRDLTDTRTEQFAGDGETQAFVVTFPVGQVPTITVNGAPQDVGIRGVDENADWYWNKDNLVISQDENSTPLGAGDTLAVTYRGLFPIIVVTDNLGAQAERAEAEGTSGLYASVEQDAALNDSDNANAKAESLLARYGQFNNGIQFETDDAVENNALSLRAGDLLPINKPTHNVNNNCLVESVAFERSGARWKVAVKALTGMQTMSWLRYWQKQATTRQEFTDRENEVLIVGGNTASFSSPLLLTDSVVGTIGEPTSEVGSAEASISETDND